MILPYFAGTMAFFCDCAGNLEGTEQIDIHLTGELVVCDVLCGSNCAGAGVVDQDIDPAIFFQDLVDHFLDHLCIGNITADRESLNSEFLMNLGGDFFNFLLSAGDGNDSRALICQCFRHLHTKSAGTSGDNRDSSFKIKILFHHYLPKHLWKTFCGHAPRRVVACKTYAVLCSCLHPPRKP